MYPNGLRSKDTLNNVERVRTPTADQDVYIIRVEGTNLSTESQKYALAASGCFEVLPEGESATQQDYTQVDAKEETAELVVLSLPPAAVPLNEKTTEGYGDMQNDFQQLEVPESTFDTATGSLLPTVVPVNASPPSPSQAELESDTQEFQQLVLPEETFVPAGPSLLPPTVVPTNPKPPTLSPTKFPTPSPSEKPVSQLFSQTIAQTPTLHPTLSPTFSSDLDVKNEAVTATISNDFADYLSTASFPKKSSTSKATTEAPVSSPILANEYPVVSPVVAPNTFPVQIINTVTGEVLCEKLVSSDASEQACTGLPIGVLLQIVFTNPMNGSIAQTEYLTLPEGGRRMTDGDTDEHGSVFVNKKDGSG